MNLLPLLFAIGTGVVCLGSILQGIVAGVELKTHAGKLSPENQRKWSVIILICVILAVSSGAGSYVIYKASTSSPSISGTISPTSTSIIASSSSTPSPTATVSSSPIPSATSNPSPTSQPTATTPPSSQLLYKENFEQNNASWSNGGYTVGNVNSIVCTDIEINTPCSGIVHYMPNRANYKMNFTVRFTQRSYVGTGNVLCLEERTNTAFSQGVKIGILATGDIYNGCLDMSEQNYIGTFHLNVLKEFDVSLNLDGADLSILVSQQGNNSSFDWPTLVDTDQGNISIIAYYPVVVSNVAIYAN